MDARQVIIEPIVSEKSYALMADGKYTFRVDDRAHKTQIGGAVEEIFDVRVVGVRTARVRSKPKRRGLHSGRTRSWKKAVVQLAPGGRIELFEGAAVAEEIAVPPPTTARLSRLQNVAGLHPRSLAHLSSAPRQRPKGAVRARSANRPCLARCSPAEVHRRGGRHR